MRQNAFMNDSLRVGGRVVSLADIRTPTLTVIATRDELTPEQATAPAPGLLTGTQVETLRLDAGHTSLFVGRTAAKITVPAVIDWLSARSDQETV